MDRCSRWTVIVNPHAGSGLTLPKWRKAKSLLQRRGVDFEEVFTRSERDAEDLVAEAASRGVRRFLAVGGDGTAHDVLEGIVRVVARKGEGRLSDYTLGVIPIGSGNDWVKGHRIPRKLEKLVGLLADERFGEQDVVKVTTAQGESYMLNVGGIGFDAMVCHRVNAQKLQGKSGKLLYVKALLYQIFHYKPSPLRVEADGKEVYSGPFYSIAFAIGPYCGGGMRQCPAAVFDDGLLEMTLVPRMPLWKLLPKMPRLFNGTVLKTGGLLFGRARRYDVSVLEGPQELIEADGEIVGHTALRLEVLPDRLKVLSNL